MNTKRLHVHSLPLVVAVTAVTAVAAVSVLAGRGNTMARSLIYPMATVRFAGTTEVGFDASWAEDGRAGALDGIVMQSEGSAAAAVRASQSLALQMALADAVARTR